MPRSSDAKEKMIETAALLFRARGYHAVGLAEILEESGAPKGSFYHHFPGGKEELAIAVIEQAESYIVHVMNRAFEGVEKIEDGISNFIEILAQVFEKSGYQLGCPITSIVVEMVPENEKIRAAADQVFEKCLARLMELSRSAMDAPEDETRLMQAFRTLLIALEGGWIIARTKKTTVPLLASKEIFRQAL